MKFELVGKVTWAAGSCHDDRSEEIHEELVADKRETAIELAQQIVEARHEKNKHLTDYGLEAELRVVTPILRFGFQKARPARPAVPAELEVAAQLKMEVL